MHRSGSLGLALLGLMACAELEPSPHPRPAPTRDGRWVQDIRYVADNVARLHKNAFRYAVREDYEAARDALVARVPELSDASIMVHLAAIVAQLRDAHTTVVLPLGGPALPVADGMIAWISGGYLLLGAPPDRPELLGARVLRVGGTAIGDAVRTLGAVVSHENAIGLRVQTEPLLRIPAVLHAMGLAEDPTRVRFDVENEDGVHQVELRVHPDGGVPAMQELEPAGRPFTYQRKNEHYWFEVLPEERALYWQYNVCYEQEGRPFAAFAEEVLAALEDPAIERIIIDLRRNGGGSQIVAWPLLKKLVGHRLDRPGGILVLIGAKTFSSAKGNALDIQEWTRAVLMGGPTRQRPTTFGEVRTFESPNFGLTVSYSNKYFERGDPDADAVRPDVEVEMSLADWQRGVDTVFEAALAYRP